MTTPDDGLEWCPFCRAALRGSLRRTLTGGTTRLSRKVVRVQGFLPFRITYTCPDCGAWWDASQDVSSPNVVPQVPSLTVAGRFRPRPEDGVRVEMDPDPRAPVANPTVAQGGNAGAWTTAWARWTGAFLDPNRVRNNPGGLL